MNQSTRVAVLFACLCSTQLPATARAELVSETLKRYKDFALHIQLSDTVGSCAPKRHRVLVSVVERFTAYAFAEGCWHIANGNVIVDAKTLEDHKRFSVTQPVTEFTDQAALKPYGMLYPN